MKLFFKRIENFIESLEERRDVYSKSNLTMSKPKSSERSYEKDVTSVPVFVKKTRSF